MPPFVGFVGYLIQIINGALVPLIFAVAFLVFIFGVFRTFFSSGADSEEKRKEGRKFIMYGIIGFFLMMSVWGIVNILVGTFGFNAQNRPPLPSFNGAQGSDGYMQGQGSIKTLGQNGQLELQPANACGFLFWDNLCLPNHHCEQCVCVP